MALAVRSLESRYYCGTGESRFGEANRLCSDEAATVLQIVVCGMTIIWWRGWDLVGVIEDRESVAGVIEYGTRALSQAAGPLRAAVCRHCPRLVLVLAKVRMGLRC